MVYLNGSSSLSKSSSSEEDDDQAISSSHASSPSFSSNDVGGTKSTVASEETCPTLDVSSSEIREYNNRSGNILETSERENKISSINVSKKEDSSSVNDDYEKLQEEKGYVEDEIKKIEKKKKNKKKGSEFKDVSMISFTFINCCIGAGLLALPKIFSVAGYVMTIIYVVASTLYCCWVFNIFTLASYHGNFSSLREMAGRLWGKPYGVVIDVAMIFCNMGFLCSYISISSDYVREGIAYLANITELENDFWIKICKVIIAVVIMFPLTLLKTVDMISYISSFAIIFTLAALIAVNVRFFQYIATGVVNGVERGPVVAHLFPESTGWPATIAYFTTFFALYTIHASMIPVQRETNGSASYRKKVTKKSSYISLFVVAVICIIIGVEGSLMFDRDCNEVTDRPCVLINSNILLSFVGDMAMVIIRILYAIVILVSFPCMLYPIRTSICEWFSIDKYNGKKKYPHMTADARKKLPRRIRNGYGYYILAGFIVLFIVTVLAVFVPEIDRILSITSNIFGLILYELHAVFVWFKLPKCKQLSVGKLLDEKMNTKNIFEEIENARNNFSPKDVGEERRSTHYSERKNNPIRRLSLVHRASIGAIEKKKYSYVFGEKDMNTSGEYDTVDEDDVKQLKQLGNFEELRNAFNGESYGSRVWNDNKEENGGEKCEKSESIPILEDDYLSPTCKTKEPNTEIDNLENELDNYIQETINASVRKTSIMQSRAMSVVEGCEDGDEEVLFPDISKEKYPLKGKRFGIFIFSIVFFTVFNVCAIGCDISGWVN